MQYFNLQVEDQMADPIGSTTQAPPPIQSPTPPPAREDDVEVRDRLQQTERAEAAQENRQAEQRRSDPEDRIGTLVDTST